MQMGMLFHYLSESGEGVNIDQHCYRLKGVIKIAFLKRAWEYVAKNNEMLRTVFCWIGLKLPVQIILKEYQIPFREYDYSTLSMNEKQKCLDDLLHSDQSERINIDQNPYRIIFCKVSDDEYYMIVSAHHIIYDGWSNGIIFKELLYAYEEYLNGREPKISNKTKYKELVRWYQNQDKQKQKVFWENYLKNYKPTCYLGREESYKSRGMPSKYMYHLDRSMEETMKDFIQQEQTTLAALIYAAWGIALQKYSGYEDTIFGVTLSGRSTDIPLVDNIVGLFVNTLPLRLTIQKNRKIRDILREVKQTIIAFEEYQGTSLVDLKQYSMLGIEGQLFDSIVVVQNYPLEVTKIKDTQKMSIAFASSSYSTNFDIALDIRTMDGIDFVFSYNNEKYDLLGIKKICECVITIINAFILDKGHACKVEDIELTNFNESEDVLSEMKDTINYLEGLEEVDYEEIF